MTGTVSSSSRMYSDFDNYKNQEWLRRRKLRIEQVRKQSSHIAKMLRQKALNEEQVRDHELKRSEEAKFRCWKAEKLDEMERKLRCALEEFGLGYKLAESEPEPNEIILMKNKISTFKAQERGEIAMEEEKRKKKLEEERKNSPIQRKKMTRKLENLRSALICSISNNKELVNTRQIQDEIRLPNHHEGDIMKKKVTLIKKKVFNPVKSPKNAESSTKVIIQKGLKKSKNLGHKPTLEVNKNYNNGNKSVETEICSSLVPNPVWINLDTLEMPSSSRTSKMTSNITKSQKVKRDKTNCTIEFYDHPSRYYCKSFRDYNNLVERVNPESQCDAAEVAKKEEESKSSESERKHEFNILSQERGNEALRREKINRDCNYMMEKLGELQKKERIMKAQQRVPLNFIHMTDERLSERIRTKQRIMESKFEDIYYEATSGGILPQEPQLELPYVEETDNRLLNTDDTHLGEKSSAMLSFSPRNLKTTSPVTSLDVPLEHPVKTSPVVTVRRSKKKSKRKKKILLTEIDKTLEEGRKLRKMIVQNRENFQPSLEEISDVEKKRSERLTDSETVDLSPLDSGDIKRKSTIKSQDRESQTDEIKTNEVPVNKEVKLKPLYVDISAKTLDTSLPLSTSTSYRSPPSSVRSYRLRKFLDHLESLSHTEENENESALKEKIQKILKDLLNEGDSSNSKESNSGPSCRHTTLSRNLEYYVLKLLNMSRECIANLSVSTLNVSSTTNTDLDEDRDNENGCSDEVLKVSNNEEELVTCSTLRCEGEQSQMINNWKSILEQNFGKLRATLATDHRQLTNYPTAQNTNTVSECETFRRSESPEDKRNEKVSPAEDAKGGGDCSPAKNKYEKITQKCSERIWELSNMLEKVRRDKEKLLNSTSGGSSLSMKGERIDDQSLTKKADLVFENFGCSNYFKNFSVLESFIDRYNLSRDTRESSTASKEDSQPVRNPEDLMTSLESLPDVMEELLKKEIITSPFKWSCGEPSPDVIPFDETEWKPSSIESVVNNFRKEMSRVKSLSLGGSDTIPRIPSSIEEEHLESIPDLDTKNFISSERNSNGLFFQEESSVESINHALTRLGLNWAKSFLKKNEESKAISSSSVSASSSDERKSSL